MSEKKLSGDVYHPTEEIINQANAKCDELYNFAERDYEGFWAKEAEELHWIQNCRINTRECSWCFQVENRNGFSFSSVN